MWVYIDQFLLIIFQTSCLYVFSPLGGLFHGPADWSGSSLIRRGSKILISQVEEIEPWAVPVWPRWARTQEGRSIPTGAATALFVLPCLLTAGIGGAYRWGLTRRCAHQGCTAVCVNDKHRHTEERVDTHISKHKSISTQTQMIKLSYIKAQWVFFSASGVTPVLGYQRQHTGMLCLYSQTKTTIKPLFTAHLCSLMPKL